MCGCRRYIGNLYLLNFVVNLKLLQKNKSRGKKIPTKKTLGPDDFTGEFCQTFRDEVILNL